MSEPLSNPFEPFFDKIREIVREEIKAASNGNGHLPSYSITRKKRRSCAASQNPGSHRQRGAGK
jgi:hypothetical protein